MNWLCKEPGPCLNIKTIFPRYGDSHVKDKTVGDGRGDRLIFNMGIPILIRWHLYIEMPPWTKNESRFSRNISGSAPQGWNNKVDSDLKTAV